MAAATTSNRLQNMLQTAVQTIQWTYSLFWQVCPQQGILVWGDGYYNGAIKTRKTVQPMEVTAEEASLQRSQQLRELYDSLAAGESNQPPTRRPSAALSPEDLTESEWFYLMCVSFSFPPGVGLPGKAYATRHHIWLTGANEVESKVFSRAILAKSARIQTVLCIPLLGGVIEFGSTKRIAEDIAMVHQVKSFFIDHHHYHHHHHPQPPRPALSEQSTSNPVANSDHTPLSSAIYTTPLDPMITGTDDDEDEEDDDEDDDGDESGLEADMGLSSEGLGGVHEMAAEPRELMQLEMSENVRLGSPEDGSNHLDSESQRLAVSQAGGESARTWPPVEDPTGNSILQPPLSEGPAMMEEFTQEDTHYSQTVTTILHHQSSRWSESSSPSMNNYSLSQSSDSAFNRWNNRAAAAGRRIEGKSQWLLKCVLFTVPFLHSKYTDDSSPTMLQPETAESRSRKGSTTQEEQLSANHVLAERRRREKLNERFIILRSLVPFVTKMDKASILGDTIEYVKQLRKKIQDLESKNRPEAEEKRAKAAVDLVPAADVQVQVSIIENDALVEIQCFHREGLLLDVMVVLRELRLEVTAVQSSLLNKEVFVAELRAKVKVDGKKPSIIEVQKAIHQIIPQC